jgi:hypothetical protein
VTHGQTVTHSLHLTDIYGVIICLTVANKSFYWTNAGRVITVLFNLLLFKKKNNNQNRRNEYTPDHVQTQFTLIAAVLYSLSHLCALLLSPCPFACELQCTTHPLYMTRRKNLSKPNHIITTTHSLHHCHHIS